ncbi:hypothetical protein MBLNU457_g0054t1 [Dothideomycetes sp. NU457]
MALLLPTQRFTACLFALLLVSRTVFGYSLERRASNATPLAFSPDQNWDGIDGSWSTFTLRVGTPSQIVRVFASWMSYQTWVVHPQGCLGYSNTTGTSCQQSRGGIFETNASSTWDNVGLYGFSIETNLGWNGNAYFGYDVVGLGGPGESGPTLTNTTIGDFAVTTPWIGLFGLNPKPTNFSTQLNGATSYMTQLKQQGLIPSVSFGYNAGAKYRYTGVLASLTLGGYDTSRFVPNNVEFTFALDSSRDTVVAIQSISKAGEGNTNDTELLPTPIYALLDATVPQIWLPIEACQAFEQAFGLVYDTATSLYLVSESLHNSLKARNANVTFTLGQSTVGGSTVSITLPYAAFDLTASPPYQGLAQSTYYFPLQRAQNSSQYTLGRTFMQEAYITVDYERAKFNISQALWVQNAAPNLVGIAAADAEDASNYSGNTVIAVTKHSSGLSSGAIGGIAAGAAVLLLLVIGAVIWHFRRRKRQANGSILSQSSDSSATRQDTVVFPKAELEAPVANGVISPTLAGSSVPPTPFSASSGYGTYDSTKSTAFSSELPGHHAPGEVAGNEIYEMPGSMPDVPIMDGKQITEKDMIRHRERQYNGVDDSSEALDKVEELPRRERRTVMPEEVRQATEEEGGNKRFSFMAGDDSTSSLQ